MITFKTDFIIFINMMSLQQLDYTFNQSAKFLINCMQVLAHFVTPPPYFDRLLLIYMLSCFFLLTIIMQPLFSVCLNIQCMSFNLEQQQPA